jgi:dynein heavy chain
MDKCFEGISKVMFDEKLCVCGMISAEAEEVDFLKKIDVNEGDRKGNVEKWMLDIEDQMIKTLRELTKSAIAEYANNEKTEWSKLFPGQIVLAAS